MDINRPGARQVTRELDELIKQPVYSISPSALREYEDEYFAKKCTKSRTMIREAQEVSACYQDADQILKGIVFSGGSRILETFPETSKEPLPKELSEDLEELEKSYKKQEFQDIEAILERLKGRLKKQKNLFLFEFYF